MATELLVVDFLVRIDRWTFDRFIDHQRQSFGPKLIEGLRELLDYARVIGCNVVFFTRVICQVEQFPQGSRRTLFRDELPTRIPHATRSELPFIRVGKLGPTTDVGGKRSFGPSRCWILEKRNEASSLNLCLERIGNRHACDFSQCWKEVDVGCQRRAICRIDRTGPSPKRIGSRTTEPWRDLRTSHSSIEHLARQPCHRCRS